MHTVNLDLRGSAGRVCLVAPHETGRAQLTVCDEVPGPRGLPVHRHAVAQLTADQCRQLAAALFDAADQVEGRERPTSLAEALGDEPKGA